MNDLCLSGVCIKFAGHTVIKTHSHGYQHITFIGLDIRTEITVHTQHTFIEPVVGRQSRKSQQSASARHIGFLDKGTQFILCITKLHSLTDQNQWFTSTVYQFGSFLKTLFIRVGLRIITTDKIKPHRFIVHHFYLSILGKVQHNRTGTSASGNIKSACHCPSHILCPTNLIAPFGDRLSDTHQINLLKRICSQERSPHLSGNHHNRRTVNHGISNAGDSIRGTGTAGNQTDSHFTRHAGKTLCRMSSSLFVTNQYMI